MGLRVWSMSYVRERCVGDGPFALFCREVGGDVDGYGILLVLGLEDVDVVAAVHQLLRIARLG